jgi:hypothetical protein
MKTKDIYYKMRAIAEPYHEYADQIAAIAKWIESEFDYNPQKKITINTDRFMLPSDKQMIEIAVLFNEGKLEQKKLSDMVAYAQFLIDRLYENGNVGMQSSKEKRINNS